MPQSTTAGTIILYGEAPLKQDETAWITVVFSIYPLRFGQYFGSETVCGPAVNLPRLDDGRISAGGLGPGQDRPAGGAFRCRLQPPPDLVEPAIRAGRLCLRD